jgi:DNA topoisomerase-3
VGRTEKPVTGFKGRSGRTFRAKLKLEQESESGKWRVDFDEEWARERPAAAAAEGAPAPAGANGSSDGAPSGEDGAARPGAATRGSRGRRRQPARRG